MVLHFLLLSINPDVVCMCPSPCVQYLVYCYNLPSCQDLAVLKMVNASFCVTSKSQDAFALNPVLSFLQTQAKMGA